MTNLSVYIPWAGLSIGCAASIAVARSSKRPSGFLGFLSAGLKAFGLGLGAFFIASLMHTVCIESLQLCQSFGDGNLGYAAGGLLGIPLYWLLLVLCAKPAD